MGRPRISTRALIVAVAVIGYDAAAMTRAVQQGRAAHAVAGYATFFGLILLVLNLVALGLFVYFAGKSGGPPGSRLRSTPSPVVIVALYVTVLAFAILSVLFFTSGRF